MAAECEVLSEIEVLRSIYLDELLATRSDGGGWEVSLVLHPSTAEDSVSQFVRLTLTMVLDQQYPCSSPSISIHNPRGLSDDKLSSVQKCLQTEAESYVGSPVLYQLIEKAKEILTESNVPHGNCVICLYGFKEDEAFTKTNCYHYFHSHCLGRYVRHSEGELRQREKELEEDKTRERDHQQELTVVCPVCREPLIYDVDQLLSTPAPLFPQLEGAAIGADFRQKWRELEKLLEQQRSKGGIIDPEVESNRFLIHINEAPDAELSNPDADVSPSPSSDDIGVGGADQSRIQLPPCGNVPGQKRQGQSRGPRRGGRGGRGRPQHWRPAPPTEHLDKLALSSSTSSSEGPTKARVQGNLGRQKLGNAEPCQPQPDGELVQPEPSASTEKQPTSSWDENPKTDCPKDAGQLAYGRGNRERRRGPQLRHHRGRDQWDAPGAGYHHWDGRGGRGGGPHRGRGRGFHQRVVERDVGREEVL
ncbi:E3 ubiquitin-protein ligase RNF25 [Diretmus argenteus]